MSNGQSAKRGLNRSISDASWGELFSKIAEHEHNLEVSKKENEVKIVI